MKKYKWNISLRLWINYQSWMGNVSQRIDLKVYKKDNLEYRRMNFMGMEESYGQYEEISQDQVKLYLKREFVHMINVDTVFVSLFAMEKECWQRMRWYCIVLYSK